VQSARTEFESLSFVNGQVRLHAVAAGPVDGPLVILLHGFPEFWRGWIAQIEPLAAAGFRVIVPDQRGYNLSSKLRSVKSYSVPELTSDVISIADQLGRERIFLAGHDWGAAVAWSTALLYPQRVAKLVIVNVPHPSVMRRHLKTDRRQMRRSWYIFFFQLPWLPEKLFRARNFRLGVSALAGSSRPGTFSLEALARYREAWSQPGALTGMLHWYRAALRMRVRFPDRMVRVPTRILWGERDAFLRAEMAGESLRYCTEGELIRFPRASHWLQHEEPEEVSRLLLEFFGKG
jgi:epoxide hydrolase 4